MRAILLVLDSVGVGASPDAAEYGDEGANTLAGLASAAGGVNLPVLQSLGLGNIPFLLSDGLPIKGVEAVNTPLAHFGAMQQVSKGKDTTTGHWEIAGLKITEPFHIFPPGPPSFPAQIINELCNQTGRDVIGNRAASGTEIIRKLGPRQMREGCWIVYTSADSVLQVAAHERIIPLHELYRACKIARELCNPYKVGRVIARPYIGSPGKFTRTSNRRDFSYPLPEPTVLNKLLDHGIPVTSIGKIDDIFGQSGFTQMLHSATNAEAQSALMKLVVNENADGLLFANFIDFDMLYGHRRDPEGYARALEATDAFLDTLLKQLQDDDVFIITADHGNDPTFAGTDHTREYVPLLAYRPGIAGKSLGIRHGFFDIAQSLATFFEIEPLSRGTNFLL